MSVNQTSCNCQSIIISIINRSYNKTIRNIIHVMTVKSIPIGEADRSMNVRTQPRRIEVTRKVRDYEFSTSDTN